MKQISILAFLVFCKFTDKPFCTCIIPSIQERVDSSEVIFFGKAISTDTLLTVETTISFENDGSKKEYLRPIELTKTNFKVIKVIKGKVRSNYISVYSTLRCCMCGFEFFQNAKYIVFANSDTMPLSKEKGITWDPEKLSKIRQDSMTVFGTSTCSGTDEYSKQLLDEVIKAKRSANRR